MDLDFVSNGVLSLGVEVELQLVDWRTRDLCPAALKIFQGLGGETARIKPELFQSMIEVCTGVCSDVHEVKRDLWESKQKLQDIADTLGVEIVGAGTHPFADTAARLIYPSSRFRMLIDRNQWIARRLTIYGVHVHVGMRDGDHAIAMMNGILPYAAYLLSLSASSPFLHGADTGLASARATVFESQPTAGTPPTFESWAHFVEQCRVLQKAKAISSLKDLWWDVRPSPGYGTLELRICDGGTRPSDTLAIVALVHCLAAELDARIQAGETMPQPAAWRLRDNKWRAARWGLDADLVTSDDGECLPARQAITELIERLTPWRDKFSYGAHFARLREMIDTGGSYTRQREILKQTRSLGGVVQALAREWREDIDVTVF